MNKHNKMMSKENKVNVVRLTNSEIEIVEQIRNYVGSVDQMNSFKSDNTANASIKYKSKPKPLLYDKDGSRVLVIGDLHCPFDLDSYLDHCKKMYNQFECDTVLFIGDLMDSHAASYHESNPDGHSAGDELELAIDRIQRYYKAFPNAVVLIGNHDRLAYRKAMSGGVSSKWIKTYKEVLNTPNWNFVVEYEIDDVLYFHGEGGTAKTRYKSEAQSVVQGHLHTQCFIEYAFSAKERKFAMQIGCGIDFHSYAFAYAKSGRRPAVSCGVVLNGKYPFLLPMDL